ncbi:MAG: DUF58 domain-containing protein [Planctomycetota bacterium]|nr:DUF58 domain-containing protein [Planctomycetota bacterium]
MKAIEQKAKLRSPKKLPHADFELVARRLADELAFGSDTSMFVGSGLEYAQSRPYEPGDSVRQLDWRLTAKTGKPFVKQYETLRRISIYLIVDTSSSMSVSSIPFSKQDMAIWIASALGLAGQRRLSPVAVVGGGERETRLEPSLSQGDFWQSIEPLRSRAHGETTQMGSRLQSLEPRLQRSSILFAITDLHDPEIGTSLRHAAQKHDVVVLHLEDPAERNRTSAGFFRGIEAETGKMFLGGGLQRWRGELPIVQELIGAGISYLHLRSDLPFVPPLRHFLASRAMLMKGS